MLNSMKIVPIAILYTCRDGYKRSRAGREKDPRRSAPKNVKTIDERKSDDGKVMTGIFSLPSDQNWKFQSICSTAQPHIFIFLISSNQKKNPRALSIVIHDRQKHLCDADSRAKHKGSSNLRCMTSRRQTRSRIERVLY
jgi:hypothetical protein